MDHYAPDTNGVRVVAISDLHGHLPDPSVFAGHDYDLLLIAGDIIGPDLQRDVPASIAWLSEEFAAWLDAVPVPEVIAIAGNHDFWAEGVGPGVHERLFGARWTYIQDASTTASGLSIYGSPWVGFLPGGWTFTAPRRNGGQFLTQIFAAIPGWA